MFKNLLHNSFPNLSMNMIQKLILNRVIALNNVYTTITPKCYTYFHNREFLPAYCTLALISTVVSFFQHTVHLHSFPQSRVPSSILYTCTHFHSREFLPAYCTLALISTVVSSFQHTVHLPSFPHFPAHTSCQHVLDINSPSSVHRLYLANYVAGNTSR
jgi:hypothetical protein